MCATIFALAGVPAPESIDVRNLMPLLTNPSGKVRDWLPLFNHWGELSAQSMAVVSSEWKYIHWYYGGGVGKNSAAMKPAEELFFLAKDRIEMTNLAGDSKFAGQLVAARDAYDVEFTAMKAKVIKGHGYEPYPVLFDRTSSWETKEPLLQFTKVAGGSTEPDLETPKPDKR